MRSLPRSQAVRSVTLAVASAAFLMACGGGEAPGAAVPGERADAPADEVTVTIERSRFEPTVVAIRAGGTVEYTNLDAFDHTVTAADASPLEFDSGSFGQGETFTQQFADAGTYDYFCAIHPTMRAIVDVG